MVITQSIKIDLVDRVVLPPVHAVQCDANTRAVAVTLTAGGVAWEPPANTAISVAFKKPDGKKGWYDKLPDGSPACSVSGNVVTAILAPEVLTAAGKVNAVIVFQDKNLNQLATFGFSILVEPNPAAGIGISNDYYKYSTMEEVSDAVEEMLDSLEGTKADIGQLILQAGEAISRVEQEAGAAIVCEETGTVIAVADSAERPLQGLKVFGRTAQNGTPSPDAPVELKSVGAGGNIGVKVLGKNLLPYPYATTTGTVFGVTYTDNGDGSITANGTATGSNASFVLNKVYLPKGTYTISCNDLTAEHKLITQLWNEGGNAPINYIDAPNPVTVSDGQYIRPYLVINQGSTVNNVTFKPQLEIGAFATGYEPNIAQTLTVSTPNGLPGIPVAGGGNYTDESGQQWVCDEVDFARGVYVQRIGKRTFNGQENWSLFGSAYPNLFTCYRVISSVDRNAFLSTAYKRFDGNYGDSMAYFAPPYTSGNFSVNDVRFTTLAEFTGYLAKNPLKVEYVLQTPIETPLSAEELAAYTALHTNKPNTTVLNDAGAGLRLGYVADTKLYIDQKFTELENAILSAGANV